MDVNSLLTVGLALGCAGFGILTLVGIAFFKPRATRLNFERMENYRNAKRTSPSSASRNFRQK